MTRSAFPFFDMPDREPSQATGFSGNHLDRRSENRPDGCVQEALGDPAARLIVMGDGRVHFRFPDGKPEAKWRISDARHADTGKAVLLGFGENGPVLAAPSLLAADILPDSMKAIDLRSVYAQGLAGSGDLGEIAQGASLLAWHAASRFCGRCGQETAMAAGGAKRVCTACQNEHFPRTDPVAIMLAVRGDMCLLGRGKHFPPGLFSCLAGFIEQGETIEAAVRRETFEEAGIRIGRVAYHASQPWPFPHSLMIGCYGEAISTNIAADQNEMEAVRWFSRAEIKDILSGRSDGSILFPPEGAIASLLVRDWAQAG